MAVVQSASTKEISTFGDLSVALASVVKSALTFADAVAVLPDRYDLPHSINSFERLRRNTFQYAERVITGAQMKIPTNFKGFLSNPKNKMHLIKFLLNEWKRDFQNLLTEHQTLLLSLLDGSTTVVVRGGLQDIPLSCDHEEADSKMFVFASHLVNNFGCSRIIISSPDTDVAGLCCYHFYNSLDAYLELYFKTGVKDKQRFVPIHEICNRLGASV